MPSDPHLPGEITTLLFRWQEGDREALAGIASLAYDDLRAIASGYIRRESRDHTLQATGLVNELYIRLSRQRGIQVTDRAHFYTLAAMMMRQILTDYARRSHAQKRPGGDSTRVPLHPEIAWVNADSDDMLALDQALGQLETIDDRTVRILELRFFLGCTNEESAEVLGISRATIDRDLEYGKAWLYRRLNRKLTQGPSRPAPDGA